MNESKKFLNQIWRKKKLLTGGFVFLLLSLGWGAHFVFAQTPSSQQVNTVSKTLKGNGLFGKTIASVEIRGLKRLEKDAILAKVGSKPGAELSSHQISADIRALFALGYFEDISFLSDLSSEGQVLLIVEIKERPVVSSVEFEGNEKISTSDLKDVVKIKQWSILDVNKVKDDVALLQKHYEDKGYYLAKVSFEIKAVKDDEVTVVYKVNDYEKVQIKKITFLNNKHFSDDQLKGVLGETREGGFFSFLSSSGNFKETAFKTDLQRLTYWYLDHGYVKFRYENPVISVSDDKRWMYITIYVDEGERYDIGSTDFSGDVLFPRDELHEGLSMKQGESFSISKRNADIQFLTEKFQDLGYAFVNVVPKMAIHDQTKTIDLDYSFDKGNLVYFGEINVLGNSKTFDKVIRRELKFNEGELFSGSKLRESRENVERLGFFAPGEVIFNTSAPQGSSDRLNVDITIKERSTGTITMGAGYGSVQGFFFTGQISEINLLGRGQSLTFAAQYSLGAYSRSFNLGFTEPYTFDTLWSSGFDLYFIKIPIPSKYTISKAGFDLRMGHPITEYTYGYLTYKLENIKILDPIGLSEAQIAADSGLLSGATISVVRDKRNNRFETTGGNYQSASLELAGLGGDFKYYKWVLNNRFYTRLIGDLVFRNNIEFGHISSYGGAQTPPSQKFYLGGPNNMKGFPFFLLGPQQMVTYQGNTSQQPLGGSWEAFSLFEVEYPLLREAGIKGVIFFDVGNAWNQSPVDIRADYGFGLRWFSPFGPLRFEWGFPIARRPGEDSPVFQFFIGPPF